MKTPGFMCGGWIDRVRGASLACWSGRLRPLRQADPRNIALFCNWESDASTAASSADAGMDALLGLLDRQQVRITFNITADLCRTHPQRVRQIAEAGHEVAWLAGGLEQRRVSIDKIREILACVKSCFAQVQLRARGFYCPRPIRSLRLLRCLHEHGFIWMAQRDTARRPYRLTQHLICVPVLLDDAGLIERRLSPGALLQAWHDRIGRAVCRGRVVAVGLHIDGLGEPEYAGALQAQLHFLRRILELRITSISELAGIAPTRPVSGPS